MNISQYFPNHDCFLVVFLCPEAVIRGYFPLPPPSSAVLRELKLVPVDCVYRASL